MVDSDCAEEEAVPKYDRFIGLFDKNLGAAYINNSYWIGKVKFCCAYLGLSPQVHIQFDALCLKTGSSAFLSPKSSAFFSYCHNSAQKLLSLLLVNRRNFNTVKDRSKFPFSDCLMARLCGLR